MKRRANRAERLRARILPLFGMLIVFVLSMSVLYLGDNVGLGNNGDFGRVIETNNISYIDYKDCNYFFIGDYKMKLDSTSLGSAMSSAWQSHSGEETYASPQFVVIKISKELNILANAVSGRPLTDYDIRYLALLYCLMLSGAAGMIFSFVAGSGFSVRMQVAVFLIFIFMFCDAGYLLYFNSFYGEPLQYVALMLLIAFGLQIYKRPGALKVIGFFLTLYLFSGAKLANVPYSLLVALLTLLIVLAPKSPLLKIGVVICSVACMVGIIGVYRSIPNWMDNVTTYQAVFFGITRESDDAEKDLRELGVDEKYAALVGTNAYMESDEYPIDITTDEFKADFYDKVSKHDIAFFYLRHPVRFARDLSTAIENSAYIRPPGLGNDESVRMKLTNKWSLWSRLRVALRFLYSPLVIFTVLIAITSYVVIISILSFRHKTKKYETVALDTLMIGLWLNLMLPVLCNGQCDITKHMFLFTNCVDILFAILLLWIISTQPKRIAGYAFGMAILTGMFYIPVQNKTVEFGRLNGYPIIWNVEREYDDGTMLLVTKSSIGKMPFDDDSNAWEDSDIRLWLNGGFLEEFTEEEIARITETQNTVPINYGSRERSESGYHAQLCDFTRKRVDYGSDTAYSVTVTDKVFIPTLDMMADAQDGDMYWILCPYARNADMQRFMNHDGFILYTDVKNEKGVRAVIRVRTDG